ncbi:hypothetical protein MXB_4935, partial [Myxobolus squamalis]
IFLTNNRAESIISLPFSSTSFLTAIGRVLISLVLSFTFLSTYVTLDSFGSILLSLRNPSNS